MGEFKDHFSGVAANYAEFRPTYPSDLFEWIASISPARERAWDCATGNGQAAVQLKPFFREVLATDASTAQIASARPAPGLQYAVASAERYGLPDSSINV